MSVTYGVLSTYPPTQCGLATFSEALVEALTGPADELRVVAVVDEAGAVLAKRCSTSWCAARRGPAPLRRTR